MNLVWTLTELDNMQSKIRKELYELTK